MNRPSQGTPVSPPSKKSKKKKGVVVENQFHSTKFIDFQAARLYKAHSSARISYSKVFDFHFILECGLELRRIQ